jgi:hypothetical protein
MSENVHIVNTHIEDKTKLVSRTANPNRSLAFPNLTTLRSAYSIGSRPSLFLISSRYSSSVSKSNGAGLVSGKKSTPASLYICRRFAEAGLVVLTE